MTKTKYYDLQMDDPQDDYDVDVVNANLKKIDEQMKTRENATDALQEPEFTVAAKRENIASKEKMPKILGKIAKFFADLKAVAFTGNYNDLSDKPTSLLANGGNSDTVNSHTVESNVPKNAKFTDTTYSNFVKSGTGAKAGLVPAPSTTAGTTKYLREDGAWKKSTRYENKHSEQQYHHRTRECIRRAAGESEHRGDDGCQHSANKQQFRELYNG